MNSIVLQSEILRALNLTNGVLQVGYDILFNGKAALSIACVLIQVRDTSERCRNRKTIFWSKDAAKTVFTALFRT